MSRKVSRVGIFYSYLAKICEIYWDNSYNLLEKSDLGNQNTFLWITTICIASIFVRAYWMLRV